MVALSRTSTEHRQHTRECLIIHRGSGERPAEIRVDKKIGETSAAQKKWRYVVGKKNLVRACVVAGGVDDVL